MTEHQSPCRARARAAAIPTKRNVHIHKGASVWSQFAAGRLAAPWFWVLPRRRWGTAL